MLSSFILKAFLVSIKTFDIYYTFSSNEGTQTDRFVIVFIEEFLGTNNISLESISLYPNPTRDIVNIISPQDIIINIELYDLMGRKINTIEINQRNFQVDLSSLKSVLYFIKISTENGSITKRIIKN